MGKIEDLMVYTKLAILVVISFVLINAVNEMDRPKRNATLVIDSAIFLAVLNHLVISLGAVLAISFDDIINIQAYALAVDTNLVISHVDNELVIIGALLATSSAISGTVFGASWQMSVIAADGYFPAVLAKRVNTIPVYAVCSVRTGFLPGSGRFVTAHPRAR